jgi:hypothetical protein
MGDIQLVYLTLIFYGTIKINDVVAEYKVHEAVGAHVVDSKLVVEKYWVAIVLVASVRVDLPDDL